MNHVGVLLLLSLCHLAERVRKTFSCNCVYIVQQSSEPYHGIISQKVSALLSCLSCRTWHKCDLSEKEERNRKIPYNSMFKRGLQPPPIYMTKLVWIRFISISPVLVGFAGRRCSLHFVSDLLFSVSSLRPVFALSVMRDVGEACASIFIKCV